MRVLLALFLPFLLFLTIGKPFQAILCLLLQITVLGWIPASLWAFYALSEFRADQRERAWRQAYLMTPRGWP